MCPGPQSGEIRKTLGRGLQHYECQYTHKAAFATQFSIRNMVSLRKALPSNPGRQEEADLLSWKEGIESEGFLVRVGSVYGGVGDGK